MNILAVCIGAPRPAQRGDRRFMTSIYKLPVEGPVPVNAFGLEGDGRVEKRKMGDEHHAVHIYPAEHYPYWEKQLGVALGPGHFGENLTVRGLDEETVRIGDVIRCGSVTLQVAQPRIPCFKLNARMGRRFSGVFLRSTRVGYFLRVIEPGQVSRGDRAAIVDSDPGSPTVRDFVTSVMLEYWDAKGLRAALRSRDLMIGWREAIEEKLARAEQAPVWFGTRTLEVLSRSEQEGGVVLTLRCPWNKPLAAVTGEQQIAVEVRPDGLEGLMRTRLPVESQSDGTATRYRVTVVRKTKADAAVHYLLEASVGTQLRVTAPSPIPRP